MEPGTDSPPDTRRTSAGGDDADGVWLSFAELGRARGISRASAARLVRRRKWRRRTDNHGIVQVFVPHEAAEMPDRPEGGHPTGARADIRADVSRAISALETAVASLTEQLAGAERRAQAAEKGREAVESEARDLRERLEQAEAAAEQARREAVHEAREAAQALDALRAVEAARLAQGLLARLRAAWRGR
jgi:regulator of replication initiation timing